MYCNFYLIIAILWQKSLIRSDAVHSRSLSIYTDDRPPLPRSRCDTVLGEEALQAPFTPRARQIQPIVPVPCAHGNAFVYLITV